ncbi:MAG TPA: recombinase family protein [Solirubrobacteraceae bacterium]|nr:recombinase family protein [Solirubrobacteraceae bacterium]
MTRVCLYTRISTDEDHQPTSLGTQRERLERYCQAMEDWHIAAAFEDQATGTTLERPGLKAALDLARQKRVDLLLVYRVDRLSRKVRQLAAFCEELDQLGVVLKSATEPFDTGSPAGRMMLQMLGVFAEFEHATIVDRVTAGLERRVREGRWMGRRIPYGYMRDPDSKALLPCPVKAPVLRYIFALYTQERQGTTSIARTLEAEGAPPPRQYGWSPNALQVILANPAGHKARPRHLPAAHPAPPHTPTSPARPRSQPRPNARRTRRHTARHGKPSRDRRPTRPAHRHRQPRASQGAATPPHQGHPRPRPAQDHPHLPRAANGSHNARNSGRSWIRTRDLFLIKDGRLAWVTGRNAAWILRIRG